MTYAEFRSRYFNYGRHKLKNAKTGKLLPIHDKLRFKDWIVKSVSVGMEIDNLDNSAHPYMLIEVEDNKKG